MSEPTVVDSITVALQKYSGLAAMKSVAPEHHEKRVAAAFAQLAAMREELAKLRADSAALATLRQDMRGAEVIVNAARTWEEVFSRGYDTDFETVALLHAIRANRS